MTRTTSPHTVYALSSDTETLTVNGVEFPVAGLYRIDVAWTGSCGNGIAEGTKYFPVGTRLASYTDAGHAEPSDSFGPGSTVHLYGTTYLLVTDYIVAYYSPGGDLVLTQSVASAADGTLSTGVLMSLLGTEGTWTAGVYPASVLPPPRYVLDDASATSFDSFSLDLTPPPAPVIHQLSDGSTTTDTTPAISGTAEPNAAVSLYLDGSGTPVVVTADGDGNWTYIPPASIGYGDHGVFATATDAAGNVSPASATSQFTVVHEAPVVGGPIVASPFGNAVSGTSSSPAGTTIAVSVNGIAAGTTTVQADGTWSLTGILGFVGGESVTATAGTGAAQSAVSNAALVTPYPPIVDSPAYAGATSVTGTSDQPAGSLVTVNLGGLAVGTATVQADGSWTLAGLLTRLSEGDTLTATVTVGGQTSAPSAEVTVAQEAGDVTPSPWVTSPIYAGAVRVSGTSVSPEGTRIDVFVDGAYVGSTTVTSLGTWTLNLPAGATLRDGQAVAATATDEVNGLGTSAPSPEVLVSANASDRTPSPVITSPIYGGATTVTGTSSSPVGTRIDVYADGVFLGTTTVPFGGSWTLAGIAPLEEGAVLRATATDEAGGHGTSTPSAPVTVLAVRSTPPIVSASLLAGSPATIHGSSVEAAGSVITVFVNGASAGTTTVGADGSWSLPGIVLAAGDLVKATVLASGKSVSADSNVVRVSGDASSVTPPPVISAPIASGATTVSGTAEPGATVDLYAEGVFLGTVTADAGGNWAFTGLPLAEDGAVYTATATLAPDGTSDWSAPVVAGTAIHLLRSDAMTTLTQDRRPLFTHATATPPYPSLETLGPNHAFNASEGSDALQPSAPDTADDDRAYLRNVATGATDPDTAVLTDNGRPLVFYELLDNNAHTLKLAKVSGAIQFTVE